MLAVVFSQWRLNFEEEAKKSLRLKKPVMEIPSNKWLYIFLAAQQMPPAASEVTEDASVPNGLRGSKSGENQPLPRAQQRSGSSASNGSDEDNEDHKSGGRSQSRIDKWKAKHEAMLKMAASEKKKSDQKHHSSKNNSASSEDEQEATNAASNTKASSTGATANGLKTNGVCQLGLPKPASVPTALSVQ